jgi:hypothetical protein
MGFPADQHEAEIPKAGSGSELFVTFSFAVVVVSFLIRFRRSWSPATVSTPALACPALLLPNRHFSSCLPVFPEQVVCLCQVADNLTVLVGLPEFKTCCPGKKLANPL